MSTTWIIILSVIGGLIVGGLLVGFLIVRSLNKAAEPLFAALLISIFGGEKRE